MIESVQYDAARVCTGALYNTSKEKLLGEVGWVSLSERRKYHKLIMFFKIMTKLVPPYVCIDEIKSVATISSYSLRSTNKIRPIRAKSNYHKFSFYPSAITVWNELPDSISKIDTLPSFKRSIANMLFSSKPPIQGDRLPNIWHTRLRLGHSTLNAHACNYGLADSNLCRCGSKEDTEHFFFDCPIYATPRVELLTSVADLISPGVNYNLLLHMGKNHVLNILLYGSADLSEAENLILFQAIQKYLKKAHRFENIFRF